MSVADVATAPYDRLLPEDASLERLREVLQDGTRLADYPHASRVEQQVLVYERDDVEQALAAEGSRLQLEAELARALRHGPGVVVFAGAFAPAVVERVTTAFEAMIADQHASGQGGGDHFAKPGANDRVWNALEKLAVRDPEGFVDYYSNDIVALASRSWLGPAYQVTSQINVVNPGGEGQTVHRDYHLGFMSDQQCGRYPGHVHELSQALTLQGAIAHCDMPVKSGPTLYLPHSQKYSHGYVAYRRPDFQEYFRGSHVQLPLVMGDAVFFNPALFHAAGTNHSADIKRMANLLQVSSAFGRAMETIDRQRVVLAVYPALLAAALRGTAPILLANAVAASAEGYAFPTNLDRDQPVDGMAPPSQADVVAEALAGHWPLERLADRLAEQSSARRSH